MLGGDHSIGYLDERMHTTPWFHATNIPNALKKGNLENNFRELWQKGTGRLFPCFSVEIWDEGPVTLSLFTIYKGAVTTA